MRNLTLYDRLIEPVRRSKDRLFVSLAQDIPSWLSPDFITSSRVFLVLFIFLFSFFRVSYFFWLNILIFIFSQFVDIFDGLLARLRNKLTWYGEFVDHSLDRIAWATLAISIFTAFPDFWPAYVGCFMEVLYALLYALTILFFCYWPKISSLVHRFRQSVEILLNSLFGIFFFWQLFTKIFD